MVNGNIKLYDKLSIWSKILIVLVLFVSVAILLEWKLDYSFFKRPIPDSVATNPLTATLFVIFSICALLLTTGKETSLKWLSGRMLLVVVLGIAILKLASIIPAFNIHVDQFLFSDQLNNESGHVVPNTMAYITAFNFLLLSLSVLFLSHPKTEKHNWPLGFVLLVGFIGLFFILGYAYRVREFHELLSYFPMSLTTGICFLFISLAILFKYPKKAFMKTFTNTLSGNTTGKILVPVAVILPVSFGYILLLTEWNNIFSVELAATLLVIAAMFTFLTFTWFTAGVLYKNDLLTEMAENNLRSQNELLEIKVAERTRELENTNKDLSDYKVALDASNIIAITNEKGIIQYANDNFSKISKYTTEELIGKDHRIINSGYHSKEFFRTLWSTISSGKIWKGELKNKAKDGSFYWVDTTIYPFLDKSGTPYKYLAIRTDISERKKAEEQLEADKQRTRFLIEHTPAAIAMFDTKMRYIMVSKRWMQDYRLGERNIIGLSHYEIFPEISEKWKEYHSRCLAGEELHCEEEIFVRADGTVEWVKWQLSPWYDVTGRIGGLILFTEVITERRKAEIELKEREKKFRDLFENSLSAMYINDIATQKVIAANAKGAELFGYKTEEDFLNNYNPFFHFVDVGDREKNFRELKEKGSITREQEMKKLDGTHFWSKVFLKLNKEKNTVQTIAIDITEEKRSKDEIAAKVKELEKANKELEAFNFISSHDLQEPLRKIKNFGSILLSSEKDNLTKDGTYYLQRMTETSEQMQLLIEDLLAYSRMGKPEIKFEKTDVNEMITDVLEEFKVTIAEKKAVIKTEAACNVKVIRFQFRQLLLNLISNALKFSDPQRIPEINITCKKASGAPIGMISEKEYYNICISDNGIGFDPKYKERIFDIFERLYGHDKYSGTGIGLAICKKIAENHHGLITANSELDKGSRFNFYLPVDNN